jgi:riboflavin biosynthesis pyrimidine reductase
MLADLTTSVSMQRLFPTPLIECTVDEAYAAPLGTRANRPWIGLCMVASIDGSTVTDGRSSGLSSATDSGVLLQLRSVADVIIVGASTVRGEGYGPPKKPGQRIGVVTGRGSIDTSTDLFTSGSGFVITTEEADLVDRGVDVIRAGTTTVDLVDAVGQIPSICVRCDFIQAEGGSMLNGALADADLLDELNLTTSPGMIGGGGPRLTSTATDLAHRFDLIQLGIDEDSFVFSRWRRRPATSCP